MEGESPQPDQTYGMAREARDELRRAALATAPASYHPAVHLLVPSSFGLGIIAVCVARLEGPSWAALATVPVAYVIANFGEWFAHKYLLHRRVRGATVLYDQHTTMHHMIYVTDDMAMRSRDELRLVLIPAFGIVLLFFVLCGPAAILWSLGLRDVALLFVATQMGYTLSYEWLHLSYHLSPDSFVGRRALIGWLRRHHAIHHDPRVMQRYNFNVTVPLADWVLRTAAPASQRGRRVHPRGEATRSNAP